MAGEETLSRRSIKNVLEGHGCVRNGKGDEGIIFVAVCSTSIHQLSWGLYSLIYFLLEKKEEQHLSNHTVTFVGHLWQDVNATGVLLNSIFLHQNCQKETNSD